MSRTCNQIPQIRGGFFSNVTRLHWLYQKEPCTHSRLVIKQFFNYLLKVLCISNNQNIFFFLGNYTLFNEVNYTNSSFFVPISIIAVHVPFNVLSGKNKQLQIACIFKTSMTFSLGFVCVRID